MINERSPGFCLNRLYMFLCFLFVVRVRLTWVAQKPMKGSGGLAGLGAPK